MLCRQVPAAAAGDAGGAGCGVPDSEVRMRALAGTVAWFSLKPGRQKGDTA